MSGNHTSGWPIDTKLAEELAWEKQLLELSRARDSMESSRWVPLEVNSDRKAPPPDDEELARALQASVEQQEMDREAQEEGLKFALALSGGGAAIRRKDCKQVQEAADRGLSWSEPTGDRKWRSGPVGYNPKGVAQDIKVFRGADDRTEQMRLDAELAQRLQMEEEKKAREREDQDTASLALARELARNEQPQSVGSGGLQCPRCLIPLNISRDSSCEILVCGATQAGPLEPSDAAGIASAVASGRLVAGCGRPFRLQGGSLVGCAGR